MTVLLMLALVVWLMSTVMVYFRTGAEWGLPADFSPNALLEYAPRANWVQAVPVFGEAPDTFQLQQIERGYLEAWQALNLALRTRDTTILKDHFAETVRPELQQLISQQEGYWIEQADLSHRLSLHTFALDKQLAAFQDRGVRIKKRIIAQEGEQYIYSGVQSADFDVVMTLDDGKWRIRHLQRRPGEGWENDRPAGADSNRVMIVDRRFQIDGRAYRPKGINYYPMQSPWFDLWRSFDADVINKDFTIIRDLGFNTIRIFIFYELFGGGDVDPQMLEKLEKLLDLADAQGLKVMVTLFDFLPNYDIRQYPKHERHLRQIILHVRQHPALLAWDLKNEADLDYDNHGRRPVQEWLSYMLSRVREYDPLHPVTIGWSSAQAATALSDQVDFLSFHFYEPVSVLSDRLDTLSAAAKGKAVMISEYGLSTYQTAWWPGGYSEAEQAEYYRQVLNILAGYQDVSFLSWTLYDFPDIPEGVFSGSRRQKSLQKHYGIIRTNGEPKPAAAVLNEILSE